MLIAIGTYGETLGHVDGKGKGVYVVRCDDKSFHTAIPDEASADDNFFGTAQLGDLVKNPTYLAAHCEASDGQVVLYIVDERTNPGSVIAARLNEATGELTPLGSPVVPLV